jgi:hypothetical protein
VIDSLYILAGLDAAAVLLGAVGVLIVARSSPGGFELMEDGELEITDGMLPVARRRRFKIFGWSLILLAAGLQFGTSLLPALLGP